jgi:Recombinase zinc beta ribbon domain
VKVPAIVSPELFEKVQERQRQNKQRYVRRPVQHLLGNMLRCAECGSAMFSYNRYYTRMTKEPRLGVYHKAAYCCIWHKRAHAHHGGVIERCHNSEIATHILDDRVLELVQGVCTTPPLSFVTTFVDPR